MRRLSAELSRGPPEGAVTIFEDNQSAISMTKNPQFHGRSKHISIEYHFVRDQVSDKTIKVEYCPTAEMIADMLTKALPKDQFTKLRRMVGLTSLDQFSGSE